MKQRSIIAVAAAAATVLLAASFAGTAIHTATAGPAAIIVGAHSADRFTAAAATVLLAESTAGTAIHTATADPAAIIVGAHSADRFTAAAATVLPTESTAGTAIHTATAGPAAIIVGAHSADGFTSAERALGPLSAARFYYTGALPASFRNSPESRLPSGVVPVISYNTQNTNVVAYVKSVNRPVWLDFHHEPEDGGAYSSGTAYVSQFEAQSRLIRSVGNPDVKVVTINAGYAYRNGRGNGLSGSYLPPASYVDAYVLDLYQVCCTGERWPVNGLADYDRFQNWLKLVQPRGKPLGLAEYGIEASDAVRGARIQSDASYLRSAFGGTFGLWCYFWNGIWQFTDAATVAVWRSLAASS